MTRMPTEISAARTAGELRHRPKLVVHVRDDERLGDRAERTSQRTRHPAIRSDDGVATDALPAVATRTRSGAASTTSASRMPDDEDRGDEEGHGVDGQRELSVTKASVTTARRGRAPSEPRASFVRICRAMPSLSCSAEHVAA